VEGASICTMPTDQMGQSAQSPVTRHPARRLFVRPFVYNVSGKENLWKAWSLLCSFVFLFYFLTGNFVVLNSVLLFQSGDNRQCWSFQDFAYLWLHFWRCRSQLRASRGLGQVCSRGCRGSTDMVWVSISLRQCYEVKATDVMGPGMLIIALKW